MTLAIFAAAVAIGLAPSAAEWLQYDRDAVESGQVWRIVTCHLTHWSLDHFLWDAAALVALGSCCERESRSRTLACIAASAVLIPLVVWAVLPDMPTYRGLSGIDSALFVLLAVLLIRDSLTERDWHRILVYSLVVAGFLGKIGFELVTSTTLFVDSRGSEMVPVALAHIVGAAVGVACGVRFPPRASESPNGHRRPDSGCSHAGQSSSGGLSKA
jgi:rhomboid family GlyGly-CTERM serine protease